MLHGISGNREVDRALMDALDSGDLDKIEAAFNAAERAIKRRALEEFAGQYRKRKDHLALHAALSMWLQRPEAQHEPPPGGAKGQLARWAEFDGLRLPTIRRDLVGAALDGTITIPTRTEDGPGESELVCFLVDKLDTDARRWLLDAFAKMETRAKAAEQAMEELRDSAFARRPAEKNEPAPARSPDVIE
jgi:hypothetical protein